MSTMEKIKDKLHIGGKKEEKSEPGVAPGYGTAGSAREMSNQMRNEPELEPRESYDEELEGLTPDERVRYLKEHEYAEKHDAPKKGSYLEKLIAKGNKQTEDQILEEERLKQGGHGGVGGAPTQSGNVVR